MASRRDFLKQFGRPRSWGSILFGGMSALKELGGLLDDSSPQEKMDQAGHALRLHKRSKSHQGDSPIDSILTGSSEPVPSNEIHVCGAGGTPAPPPVIPGDVEDRGQGS